MHIEIHVCECCGCTSDRTVVFKLARVCPRCCGFGGVMDSTGYGVEQVWSKDETLRRLHEVMEKQTAKSRKAQERVDANRAVKEGRFRRDVDRMLTFCRDRWAWEVKAISRILSIDEEREHKYDQERKEYNWNESQKRKARANQRYDSLPYERVAYCPSYLRIVAESAMDVGLYAYGASVEDSALAAAAYNELHFDDIDINLFSANIDQEWKDHHKSRTTPDDDFMLRHYGARSRLWYLILVNCRPKVVKLHRLQEFQYILEEISDRKLYMEITGLVK